RGAGRGVPPAGRPLPALGGVLRAGGRKLPARAQRHAARYLHERSRTALRAAGRRAALRQYPRAHGAGTPGAPAPDPRQAEPAWLRHQRAVLPITHGERPMLLELTHETVFEYTDLVSESYMEFRL